MKILSEKQKLIRHQYNIADYWDNQEQDTPESQDQKKKPTNLSIPDKWELNRGLKLRPWQEESRDLWFKQGKRGIAKVVTGAGKTILALSIVEKLQNEENSALRVAIVVPTIVLQHQWLSHLKERSNLPESAMGLMGGGGNADFKGDCKILICVMATARKKIPEIVKGQAVDSLMLIVDECHRAGARKMSEVFEVQRSYNLGLSATPERNDESDESETFQDEEPEDKPSDESLGILEAELGHVFYELDFARAIDMKILSEFEVRHYGLSFSGLERSNYEKLSRKITELRQPLMAANRSKFFMSWVQKTASGNGPQSDNARNFVNYSTQRKQLLYHCANRQKATLELVKESLKKGKKTKVIIFHESISEVMKLFALLLKHNLPAVVDHSKLPEKFRSESIHMFREGAAQILVSAKTLVEGFDVPEADVGIVVASSSSVRQRIQTLGRILRKSKRSNLESAVLNVLYMSQSTDEFIYEKHNWDSFIGASRNHFFTWDPESKEGPVLKKEPPKKYLSGDDEVDPQTLAFLGPYPGKYEGTEFSIKTDGCVYDLQGRMAGNPQGMLDLFRKAGKSSGGRFRITPLKKCILIPGHHGNQKGIIFGGVLDESFDFSEASKEAFKGEEQTEDLYLPGWEEGEDFLIKQKSGQLRIAKKLGTGMKYARSLDPADSKENAASMILDSYQKIRKQRQFNKIRITKNREVIYRFEGRVYLLTKLVNPLEI